MWVRTTVRVDRSGARSDCGIPPARLLLRGTRVMNIVFDVVALSIFLLFILQIRSRTVEGFLAKSIYWTSLVGLILSGATRYCNYDTDAGKVAIFGVAAAYGAACLNQAFEGRVRAGLLKTLRIILVLCLVWLIKNMMWLLCY